MKKVKITLFAITCFLGLVLPTESLQAQAYSQGEIAISGGFGAGAYRGVFVGYSYLPLVFHGEYGINDIISGGAFIGFGLYTNLNAGVSISPDLAIGVRASGHLFPILNKYANTSIDEDKADVYLAVLTGAKIQDGDFTSSPTSIIAGPVLGAKYYFAGPLAVFAELGTGALTYATLGLTLRIGGN